jgi:hypothetical protein
VLEPSLDSALPIVHIARFLDPRTVREVVVPAIEDDVDEDGASVAYKLHSVAVIRRVLGEVKVQLPRSKEFRKLPSWASRDDIGHGFAEGIGDLHVIQELASDIDRYLE